MGETRVDLQHLLEDLRDAYPGSLEETIVTEIVANSLDSGAIALAFDTDPARALLRVVDDGSGMSRRQLARYHDIAASKKLRGEGIGFAGVGIKLGLLAADEVYTETRRGKTHVATVWRFASRHRAPWRWVPPMPLLSEHGTAVRLKLHNPLSPLLDSGFLEGALRRHFQPLFDPGFDPILAEHYPRGIRFVVNGRHLDREVPAPGRAEVGVRLGRKRRPSAAGYLERSEAVLGEEGRGLAVSTLGKVIKRGWDWLGLAPALADRVCGLIEVPGLAECLTLNKADFFRAGSRGALYLTYRKALQEAVSAQLAAWGDTPDALSEQARRRKARPVERDIAAVLRELADEFPLIASLVERRIGGQRRLDMPTVTAEASRPGAPTLDTGPAAGEIPTVTGEDSPGRPGASDQAPPAISDVEQHATPADADAHAGDEPGTLSWPETGGRRRRSRLGLAIQFESRPDDPQLGRLVETTVWVNEAHPAYRRAAASRAEGYHLALTVAMSLAPLAVEAPDAHAFVTSFLAHWGETIEHPNTRRRTPRRGKGRA